MSRTAEHKLRASFTSLFKISPASSTEVYSLVASFGYNRHRMKRWPLFLVERAISLFLGLTKQKCSCVLKFACDQNSDQKLRSVLTTFCTYSTWLWKKSWLSSLMAKSLKPFQNGLHFKYLKSEMSWTAYYYYYKPNTPNKSQ